jgi:hypothetical protein
MPHCLPARVKLRSSQSARKYRIWCISMPSRSPLSLSACRACRRRPNNCCGVKPCRRATADTVSLPSQLSAMICAFCSAVHARRRPAPVKTSTRRTVSGLDLCRSSVSDMCPTPLKCQRADTAPSRPNKVRGGKTPLTLRWPPLAFEVRDGRWFANRRLLFWPSHGHSDVST